MNAGDNTARAGQGLLADRDGVTIVEFGLISPVLLLSVIGILDIGYNIYTQAIVKGAIQQAARNSTIEGAGDSETEINERVTRVVQQIVPNATLRFGRMAYTNFADVSQPEDFTDIDGDGQCDDGEPFEDANGNGAWDSDRGKIGMGGARDAVLYRVSVSYPRAFPLARMIGLPGTVRTEATTVLRNQPYGDQNLTVSTGRCT